MKNKNNNMDGKPYRLGVGIMLFNDKGLVFAGERKNISNAWQMPQGGIDKNEQPAAAMARELYEETGIVQPKIKIIKESTDWISYDLPPRAQKKLWYGKYAGQKQKWYLCQFLGGDEDVNLNAHQPPEFIRWGWRSVDELLSLTVEFKKELYKTIFAQFVPTIKKIIG